VVTAPDFDLPSGVVERDELMHVQALVAQASVERLDESVLYGFAGPDEVELDAALIRPVLERSGGELRAVIDGDRARDRAAAEDSIEGDGHGAARHGGGDLQQWTLATPLVDYREHPELPSVGQRIVDEIHAPALPGPGGCRCGPAMEGDVLPPA